MTRPASPYWREFVDAFDNSQIVHLPAADLRRLVDQLDALSVEVERAKADAEHEAYLRRAAEVDRDRMERQLYRTDT